MRSHIGLVYDMSAASLLPRVTSHFRPKHLHANTFLSYETLCVYLAIQQLSHETPLDESNTFAQSRNATG
jgi:hypothetical protein